MNALKSHRELDDVPEQLALDSVAIGEQPLHLCRNIFGQRRLPAADFVGIALVIAPTEYQSLRLPLVRVWSMACSSLMSYPVSAPLPRSIIMSMRRKWLAVSMMSPTLTLSSLTPGVGFEDVARLIVGQAFAPDVVGVVAQVDLDSMANAAGALAGLFIPQDLQQRSWRFLIAATGF